MKKRYNLAESVINHIFHGDNNNGALSGFHSEAEVAPDVIVFSGDNQARALSEDQTYVASVKVRVGGVLLGPKKSSFFPRKWSKEQTLLWLEQGLTSMNPQHAKLAANTRNYERPLRQPQSAGVGLHFGKFKANKVTCYILYQDGQIASIFPYAPGYGEG